MRFIQRKATAGLMGGDPDALQKAINLATLMEKRGEAPWVERRET